MTEAALADDVWATATATDEGRPVVYRYRMNRPRRLAGQAPAYALEVAWPYDGEAQSGMPPPEVNRQQCDFEAAIDELSEGPLGYLMLVATGDDLKCWLFYVRDPGEWIDRLNDLLAGHPEYPLELPHWSDPDWSEWSEFAASVTETD